VTFATISLCVISQLVFTVVVFRYDSVRKLLDTPSYVAGGLANTGYSINEVKFLCSFAAV